MIDLLNLVEINEENKKEIQSMLKKKGFEFLKGLWKIEINADYTYREVKYIAELQNGNKLELKFHKSTVYKKCGNGNRLRDPKRTKFQIWFELELIKNYNTSNLGSYNKLEMFYKSSTGEGRESNSKIQEQRIKIEEFAKNVFGIENVQYC